eukprot:gi/632984246/ref/XP_007909045.1/ PREDICTED: ETS translocation variant 1-like [Callorhinchus milii]
MDCCLLHVENHHPCDMYGQQHSLFHTHHKTGECTDIYQAANDTGFTMFPNDMTSAQSEMYFKGKEEEFFPLPFLPSHTPQDTARDSLELREHNFFTGLLATVTTSQQRQEAEVPVWQVFPSTEPSSLLERWDVSSNAKEQDRVIKRGMRNYGHGRSVHLWEFVRDLLLNPAENCGVLKWEDRKEGVFRVVHSHTFAQLWGKRKSNSGMNYEKLSRALRHYYKSGILEHVGRRLTYKFGAKASGWQDSGFQ